MGTWPPVPFALSLLKGRHEVRGSDKPERGGRLRMGRSSSDRLQSVRSGKRLSESLRLTLERLGGRPRLHHQGGVLLDVDGDRDAIRLAAVARESNWPSWGS